LLGYTKDNVTSTEGFWSRRGEIIDIYPVNYEFPIRLEFFDNIIEDVSVIKNQYQIPNNLRSCHSAQIANYTIEGHVPIESINKLFREKPNINGIAVPGMPLGSPGMEMHSHESHSHDYENYKVVSFSKTGKAKIFDKIFP